MLWKFLIFAYLLTLSLNACASPQPAPPEAAQAGVVEAWLADQHTIWEMEWPGAPVGGPVTVETWRAGPRYRYEILESTAPALVGETLIFDGQIAWQYNRFFDDPPLSPRGGATTISKPALSPVSDAFAIINQLVIAPAQTASQMVVQLNLHPAQKITLTFTQNDQLALWRDEATGLPIQVTFSVGAQQATLRARSFEQLVNPPEGLFKP